MKKIAKDCLYNCLNRITGKVFNHITAMAASNKPRWKTLKRPLFSRSLLKCNVSFNEYLFSYILGRIQELGWDGIERSSGLTQRGQIMWMTKPGTYHRFVLAQSAGVAFLRGHSRTDTGRARILWGLKGDAS